MARQTICLVGKPNCGKSTLFNRIVGSRVSIIEDAPGVTRDRIISNCLFNDKSFYLIDTGGISLETNEFSEEIKMQVDIAIEESDTIIFVVDGKDGLTSSDLYIRDILKKSNKKVVVAINKIDTREGQNNTYDFYSLGFDEYYPISGERGLGVKELLKSVTDKYEESYEETDNNIKISLIGRPNVGKSSLVNALLNENRVIVSDIAGTTRDAIDTKFVYNNIEYTLIDTAGLRKKGRIFESVEKYSLLRSMKAIDRSDVCVLVLDANEGIVEHDKHIAGYALEAGKSVVLAVNKWDLIDTKKTGIDEWNKKIKNEFQFMTYAKVVYLSALTKKRVHTLMPEVLLSYNNSIKEIKTNIINDIISNAYIEVPPATYKTKRLKIYFSHQSGIKPPKFTIEVNSKNLVHFSYKRYLENKIRENIDFSGCPIVLEFKNKGEREL